MNSGGVDARDNGGAVVVNLTNVTVGPTAGGAGLLARNDGGGSATVNIVNTLFASNCLQVGGPPINDLGGNRRAAGTGCVGTDATLDLGALADNGGFTQTVAVGAASDAINAATTNCPATDQRGVARTSTCDSGAFERTAVNQPPVISPIPGQTLDEDQPTGPIAFMVADSDTAGGAGLSLSISGNTASGIIPNGSYTFLGSGATRALRGTPNVDANGTGTVTVQVTDAGSATAISAFTLTYNAVNDAPVFNALGGNPPASNEDGGAQTVNAFTTGMARGPVTATDESGQALTFNLSQTATTGGLAFSTAPAIDSATGNLTYTASPDSSGTATYDLTLSDNGGTGHGGVDTSAVQSFTITVTAINDPPTNTVPGAQNTPEDTTLTFSTGGANAISVTDADAGAADVTTTVSVSSGTLAFAVGAPTGALTSFGGSGTATLALVGTAAEITSALDGVVFTPAPGFSAAVTLTMTTNDGGATGTGGAQQDVDLVTITVAAVNDPPVNTVPAAQNTAEDTPLVFTTGNGNAISVADPDAGSADIQTTITVSGGTVAFAVGAPTAALTTATGSSTATLTLVGTATEITAALQGMVFTPIVGSSGAVTLTITTNDLGNTGTGGALQDIDTVSILVNSVNDPPVNTAPAAQSTPANTPLVFSTGNGNAISVADPDAGAATNVQVTLSVPAGVGVLTRGPSGLTTATGNGTNQLQLTGSLANLNADLQGLTFTPQSGVTGPTVLTLVTNDAGNSGGAALQDTDTVQITVLALPSVAISDASVQEGDSGTRSLQYTVSLSAASNLTVTVQHATADGTANGAASCSGNADYQSSSGALTFSPGETSKAISVTVCGDATVEPDETVQVNLTSPVNAVMGDGQATGTIRNDDEGGSVSFTAATAAVNENGGSVTVTVQRSGGQQPVGSSQGSQRGRANGRVQPAALGAITVQYTTSDGTAGAGRDYTAVSGALSFGADETTKTIIVPIRDDAETEPNETFTIALANPTGGATLGSPGAVTVTIVDTSVPASPLQGQDDTDPSRKGTKESQDIKETEEQRQNREQTNRSNRDDIATEGNVVAVHTAEPVNGFETRIAGNY